MRYLTAGESHGRALTTIIEGCPANLHITAEYINRELARRQTGYGRGGRMKIETDKAEILSGVRNCTTLGSPISIMINNRDYENWADYMSADQCNINARTVTRVRPAHADLAGAIKYNQQDARNILERASARETAARVAAGAVAKRLLEELGITVTSYVESIGGIACAKKLYAPHELSDIDNNPVRCPEQEATQKIMELIDKCTKEGDTLGGRVKVIISGVKSGIGSHVQYDRKLDYMLMGAIGSIQAVKGVGIGLGFEYADLTGGQSHDEIFWEQNKVVRPTNNSGGIDGGISNGEDIIITAAVKPIPTLMKGLRTIDMNTKKPEVSVKERSDVCAVPAAAVVCEAVAASEIARAILECMGGDHMDELKSRWSAK